jgi:hypothetical protein
VQGEDMISRRRLEVTFSNWVNALDTAFQGSMSTDNGSSECAFNSPATTATFIYRCTRPRNDFSVEARASASYRETQGLSYITGDDQNDTDNTAAMRVEIIENGTRRQTSDVFRYAMTPLSGDVSVNVAAFRIFFERLIGQVQ